MTIWPSLTWTLVTWLEMRAPITTTAGDCTVPKVRTMSGNGAFSAVATVTGIGPAAPRPDPPALREAPASWASASTETSPVRPPTFCHAVLVAAGNSKAAPAIQATATIGTAMRALSIGKLQPWARDAAPSHPVRIRPSASLWSLGNKALAGA